MLQLFTGDIPLDTKCSNNLFPFFYSILYPSLFGCSRWVANGSRRRQPAQPWWRPGSLFCVGSECDEMHGSE